MSKRTRRMRVDPRFRELYEAEYGAVLRATWLLSGDRFSAEDATQEAFARCLERWGRLKDRPWVAGWVATTALNCIRRSLRRGREAAAAAEPLPDVEARMDLWRGIRALPRRQREAVLLHYAMDLPVAQVAAAMGCADGTVKAHLARARFALRERMEVEADA